MSYPRKSLPMYFPAKPFSLPIAVYSSELVITAYDMYEQWVTQNYPTPSNFNWTPHGPPKGPALNYSAPIWGQTFWSFMNEPFAFVAYSAEGNIYFVARGSETLTD